MTAGETGERFSPTGRAGIARSLRSPSTTLSSHNTLHAPGLFLFPPSCCTGELRASLGPRRHPPCTIPILGLRASSPAFPPPPDSAQPAQSVLSRLRPPRPPVEPPE
ncbi:kinase suppressor of Ras 2 [Platysternon megacephalum]|uniref:Kinase suppressor of Ras 2 n=1 Tax=Platysternon megacephalum TaxID=55544 RepID=A0A4D9EE03_9SAUR|nr:kinase suppressor of Ras 2 [Platysternon megacephalum]